MVIYHSVDNQRSTQFYPRSKEYCFFFQIPLNRELSLNFLSVESAISWASASSFPLFDPLFSYSAKRHRN